MAVLLGLADEAVRNDKLSWDANKIGGKPDWPYGGVGVPGCGECGQPLQLACQLYCPLEGSRYHRTLYVFVCIHRPCWNSPHGWRVLRCQRVDSTAILPTAPTQTASASWSAADWGVGADDWGDDNDDESAMTGENPPVASSVTEGANVSPDPSRSPFDLVASIHGAADVSSHSFVGGNATQNQQGSVKSMREAATVEGSNSTVSNQHCLPLLTSSSHQSCCAVPSQASPSAGMATSRIQPSGKSQLEQMASSGEISSKEDAAPLPDLVRMTLQPDTEMAEEDQRETSECATVEAEPLPLNEERVRNLQQILAFGEAVHPGKDSDSGVGVAALTSFHLNVYEETPTWEDGVDATLQRAKEAQTKYEQEHGVVVGAGGEAGDAKSGGGGGEKYEKVGPRHRDISHHKFLSCVQKYPGLCVRYQWQGNPLWISRPTTLSLPSRCCHCGGPCCFELQLMPALIHFLKAPGQSESVVEFGTVLVFSCTASCWEGEEEGVKEENVFVQPDPDQHLFRA